MIEFLPRLLLILLLVFLNGFFVASEFSLVAIRKTRIQDLARKGNKSAERVHEALKHLNTYISATQLGITLASLALGWIGEPALAHFIEPIFGFIPDTAAVITSHSLAVALAFFFITLLHIVLGELAPKSVALQKAEATSMAIIAPLQLFTVVFKPFIFILNTAGNLVLKLFGLHTTDENEQIHSEEEVKMILANSAQKGVFEKNEVDMVYKVLQFTDMPIQQVMIPRMDIIAFNDNDIVKELFKKMKKSSHSRFPVYEKTIDSIIGFVHIKDLFAIMDTPAEKKCLTDLGIVRDIIYALETKPADEVLYEMRKKRIHIAVVKDEYGGTAGIVTLEDIIESIIGDIKDEFEKPGKSIEKQKDGSYIVSGLAPVLQVKQKINLPIKGQGYSTIGGMVYGLLGRSPIKGDTLTIGTVAIKVLEIERNRIKKLQLKKTNN
ncbi:MAG: hemolysin family protein [Patescibacteria group bacterium]